MARSSTAPTKRPKIRMQSLPNHSADLSHSTQKSTQRACGSCGKRQQRVPRRPHRPSGDEERIRGEPALYSDAPTPPRLTEESRYGIRGSSRLRDPGLRCAPSGLRRCGWSGPCPYFRRFLLTDSLSSLPALKRTLLLARMLIEAPVAGLRPLRAARSETVKLP